jgi:hypothetical protein
LLRRRLRRLLAMTGLAGTARCGEPAGGGV